MANKNRIMWSCPGLTEIVRRMIDAGYTVDVACEGEVFITGISADQAVEEANAVDVANFLFSKDGWFNGELCAIPGNGDRDWLCDYTTGPKSWLMERTIEEVMGWSGDWNHPENYEPDVNV